MSLNPSTHPDEKQLIAAVVDKNDIDEDLKRHLHQCRLCSDKIKAYQTALADLGAYAEKFAPASTLRPRLPAKKPGIRFWRPALAAVFTLALAVWGIWWAYNPPQTDTTINTSLFAWEVWEDDAFMAEISSLSKNAIPGEYRELLEVFNLSQTEDIPPEKKESRKTQSSLEEPGMKGKPLC